MHGKRFAGNEASRSVVKDFGDKSDAKNYGESRRTDVALWR
jgi:hypothetical protein